MFGLPLWFIYALVSSVTIGFWHFSIKILSEENKSEFYFFLYFYGVLLVFSSIAIGFFKNISFDYNFLIILISFLFVGLYYFLLETRIKALKYISSSIYFINYSIASSISLIFIGILIFSEKFSIFYFFGFLLGFTVFYLLHDKSRNDIQEEKDFVKGIKMVFVGVIFISIFHTIYKFSAVGDLNIFSIMFFQGVFGILLILFRHRKKIKENIKMIPSIKEHLFFGGSGLLNCLAFLFIFFAFMEGNLSIVYKIVSYSIFIPIMLSMIFYKEKITTRKTFAFALTIISLWFFL